MSKKEVRDIEIAPEGFANGRAPGSYNQQTLLNE